MSKHFGSILPTWFLDGRSMPQVPVKRSLLWEKVYTKYLIVSNRQAKRLKSNPSQTLTIFVDIFSLSSELHQTKACFISSWKPFEIQNELKRSKRHEALFPEWSLFHWHLRILRLILDNYPVWGGASHRPVIRARVVQIKLIQTLNQSIELIINWNFYVI